MYQSLEQERIPISHQGLKTYLTHLKTNHTLSLTPSLFTELDI